MKEGLNPANCSPHHSRFRRRLFQSTGARQTAAVQSEQRGGRRRRRLLFIPQLGNLEDEGRSSRDEQRFREGKLAPAGTEGTSINHGRGAGPIIVTLDWLQGEGMKPATSTVAVQHSLPLMVFSSFGKNQSLDSTTDITVIFSDRRSPSPNLL